VLPLLAPGRSLRFVALPPGDDPDSIIAKRGAQAFRDLLTTARPLADLLTDMVLAGRSIDTPERRADFEKQLLDFARKIGDSTVRSHYERYFKDRLWDTFRARRAERTERTGGQRRPGETRRQSFAPVLPEPPMRDWLGSGTDGSSERRERLLVAMVVAHPELLATVEEEFAALDIQNRDLDALRGAILNIAHDDDGLDTAVLKRHLSGQGYATLAEGLSSPVDWPERRLADRLAQPGEPLAEIEKGWRHVSARHRRAVTLQAELRAAQEEFAENMTDEAFLGRQIESSAGDEVDLDELQLVSEE
jgi:DNA primase